MQGLRNRSLRMQGLRTRSLCMQGAPEKVLYTWLQAFLDAQYRAYIHKLRSKSIRACRVHLKSLIHTYIIIHRDTHYANILVLSA